MVPTATIVEQNLPQQKGFETPYSESRESTCSVSIRRAMLQKWSMNQIRLRASPNEEGNPFSPSAA